MKTTSLPSKFLGLLFLASTFSLNANAELDMSIAKAFVILDGIYQQQIIPQDYEVTTVQQIPGRTYDYRLEFKNEAGKCLEVQAYILMAVVQDKKGNVSTVPKLATYPPMKANSCSQ